MRSQLSLWQQLVRGTTAFLIATVVSASGVLRGGARAADWPQFLGPERNGTYPGLPLGRPWPEEGPPVAWQRSVGQGFSGPVVSGNRVILLHPIEERAVVEASIP